MHLNNLLYYIPLALFIITMLLAFIFQHLKITSLKEELNITSLVNKSSIGGYFLWEAKDNIIKNSSTLLSIFSLYKNENELATIAKLFDSKASELIKNFESLKDGKIESFRFDGKANTKNTIKDISCYGCAIIDSKRNVQGAIIWFFDVSAYCQNIKELKSVNSRLTNEVEEYSRLLNNIKIPVWERNIDLKIKFCNETYSKLVEGQAKTRVAGIAEIDKSLYPLAVTAKENNKSINAKQHVVIGGERKFYNITETAVRNGTIGFAYDITDQYRTEQELEKHISAHAALLESSSIGMAVYGADTKLKLYNHAIVNLWDLPVKLLDTHPTYSEILDELSANQKIPNNIDFKEYKKRRMTLFQNITKPHEDTILLPEGKSIRIIVIPHALGGLLFAYEDVTNKLAMERSFNTLIALQRETIDNLNDAIALFGADGHLRIYNPSFLKIWSEEEAYLASQPHISNLVERAKGTFLYKNTWEEFKDGIIADILSSSSSSRKEQLSNGHVINIISRPLHSGDTLVSFVEEEAGNNLGHKYIIKNPGTTEPVNGNSPSSIMNFSEELLMQIFNSLNTSKDRILGTDDSQNKMISLINDVLRLTSPEEEKGKES